MKVGTGVVTVLTAERLDDVRAFICERSSTHAVPGCLLETELFDV